MERNIILPDENEHNSDIYLETKDDNSDEDSDTSKETKKLKIECDLKMGSKIISSDVRPTIFNVTSDDVVFSESSQMPDNCIFSIFFAFMIWGPFAESSDRQNIFLL